MLLGSLRLARNTRNVCVSHFTVEWQFVDEEKLPERVLRLKPDDF